MRKSFVAVSFLFLLSLTAQGQGFSSGSTGADGALDLSTMNCPNNICEVQLPESGIFNYTTVNIPAGKELRFKRNLWNTPVIMLAQGNVTIGGTVSVSAIIVPGNDQNGYSRRTPGPGGFYGGANGQPGFGPGGGQGGGQNCPQAALGRWIGPLSLVPIIGGSGGGSGCSGNGGGGGGGALVTASSTSIALSSGANIYALGLLGFGYGSGSGGAIRLVSNSLNVAGRLGACVENFENTWGGNCGVVRLEAPSGSLAFTGSSNPAAVLSPINPVVVPSAPPSLTIISIGGYAVPSYAGTRFDTVDLLLPNQLTDPITVVVRGNNIPLGTQVDVRAVNGSPQATYTPGTLSGTFESSTATPTMSNLNRTGVTYVLASAVFDPPQGAANFNPKGPDHVAKVRVEAVPGAKPKYVFLRSNGTVIDVAKLSKPFLQHFGQ